MNEEQQAANELDNLFADKRRAEQRVAAAATELKLANAELARCAARYKRQALWIRADELRKELARVENQAANIIAGD